MVIFTRYKEKERHLYLLKYRLKIITVILGTSTSDKLVRIVGGVCASIFIIVIGVVTYKRKALVARFKKRDCKFTDFNFLYFVKERSTIEISAMSCHNTKSAILGKMNSLFIA